jgi:hypothetical protein
LFSELELAPASGHSNICTPRERTLLTGLLACLFKSGLWFPARPLTSKSSPCFGHATGRRRYHSVDCCRTPCAINCAMLLATCSRLSATRVARANGVMFALARLPTGRRARKCQQRSWNHISAPQAGSNCARPDAHAYLSPDLTHPRPSENWP